MVDYLRSSFKYFIILGLLIFPFEGQTQKLQADFAFIYWMPYDNNLSHWADTIYNQIQAGISSNKIIVTIQKDLADKKGMTRSLITNNGTTSKTINDEKSYSGNSYYEYLEWVIDRVSSESYILVFLNHGGKLDQVGLDEYPQKDFLRIDSIAFAIKKFNEKAKKKTELIYLQVCTKGSIEPLYELKDVSSFTMFSQTILGAPNFYYNGFFKGLSNNKDKLNGNHISNLIVKHERPDMYSSLICIDNSKFKEFTKEFSTFISLASNANQYRIDRNKLLFYFGQTYFDLRHFSLAFTDIESNNLSQSINNLIVMKKLSGKNNMMDYSGISILGIQKNYDQYLSKYKHLKFFKDFDMASLYHTILYNYEKEKK